MIYIACAEKHHESACEIAHALRNYSPIIFSEGESGQYGNDFASGKLPVEGSFLVLLGETPTSQRPSPDAPLSKLLANFEHGGGRNYFRLGLWTIHAPAPRIGFVGTTCKNIPRLIKAIRADIERGTIEERTRA